jgi:hypothetical protein
MGTKIFGLLLCLTACHFCYSQNSGANNNSRTTDTLETKQSIATAFYIIKIGHNTLKTTENMIISLDDVDSATSIPYGKSVAVCKELGVSIIAIIYPKPGIKFISLKEIFKLFHLASIYDDLPIRIDNDKIKNPETIEAEESEIFTVKVVKQQGSNSYLNIITKHSDEGKKFLNSTH